MQSLGQTEELLIAPHRAIRPSKNMTEISYYIIYFPQENVKTPNVRCSELNYKGYA